MDTIEENLRQRISQRGERFAEACEEIALLERGGRGEAMAEENDAGVSQITGSARSGSSDAPTIAVDPEDSWSALLSGRNAVMLALVSAGIGLHAFNSFAIVAAMPLAAEELGGAALFSWAYSLYFIGSIAGGTGAAAFRDRVGPVSALLVSCLLFTLGGLAALIAPNFSFILTGRLLQGIADGLIVAIAYSLIPGNFRSGLISRVFAVEAMVWAVASLLGPLAGGWLAEAFSWRISFLAVVPFLLLLLVLTPMAKPEASTAKRAAAAPFAIGMLIAGALVLSLSSVASSALGQVAAVVAGIALFILAIVFDGRLGPKLLPADAFGAGSVFGCGLWVLLLMSLSHSVGAVYLALAISEIWAYRPTVVGAIVLLMALTWSVVAVFASRHPSPERQDLRTRMGPLFQVAGFVCIAIGLTTQTIALVVFSQIMIGTGFGLAWANVNRAALAGASDEDRDRAGALLPTVSTGGYAIGAGLAGLVATATGLVANLHNGSQDTALAVSYVWLYGLAAVGAIAAFLFSLGVRLPR
ncbi:MFS transporter [Rhizobiales bacterium RZME27]|uniref:MFS transporter n=1 Tax=Endobacterium cereale TaxID=2663029 RepID=A0A6A8AJ81_9HYPH|nr:MFS transporter [Endobacterium cereale]MEB2842954.1 MFS transporter [Endobacterium cereale]MQY49790.1 MFS transporter [Endobacterium cereale]